MPVSQNLRFATEAHNDLEFDHPPGAALMRLLSAKLATLDWSVSEMDNWRDCGWSVVCRKGEAELDVVLSQIPNDEWMLQVSAHRAPGLIGRLFGIRPSASPSEVHELALNIHRALSTIQALGSPRWRWDGFPDETNSTSEPQAAS